MRRIPVEFPPTRVALGLPREPFEFRHPAGRVIARGQALQLFPDVLVEALSLGLRDLTGALHQLLVDGQSDIHIHIISYTYYVRQRALAGLLSGFFTRAFPGAGS